MFNRRLPRPEDEPSILSPSNSERAEPAEEFLRRWRLGRKTQIEDFLTEYANLSPAELADVIRIDQRERWRSGERVSAEQYLERFPEIAAEEELAVDVAYSEFLLREEHGEMPDAAEYQNRFPHLSTVLSDQIAFHQVMETEHAGESGSNDTLDHVFRRNPALHGSKDFSSARPVVANAYEIIEELGRGSTGIVYRARHLGLNRFVALKVLRASEWVDEDQLQRFRSEAETIARLHHPHIVQIYDYGDHEGVPYFALELVEGGTLAAKLEGKPWPSRFAAELVSSISHAMHFAHECGVIHRDLKPANILIESPGSKKGVGSRVERLEPEEVQNTETSSGPSPLTLDSPFPDSRPFPSRPKITDFGLAKTFFEKSLAYTVNGAILGTPNYMAPEQASGDVGRIGPATDVYALGAILYELLTGKPPFKAPTALETLNQVLSRNPDSICRLQPSVPKDLVTICTKCLSKDSALRYPTALELAEDLDRFLSDRPILARPMGTVERTWKWCRRNPMLATLGSSVALLLIAVAAISSAYSFRLSAQLQKTLEAEVSQQQANQSAQLNLWDAYLTQIAAWQSSRRIGQRFDALQTVDKANQLLNQLGRTPERVLQLRNATIAALVLPDIHLTRTIGIELEEHTSFAHSTATDQLVAITPPGDITVFRLSTNEILFRILDQTPGTVPLLSADGKLLAAYSTHGVKVWKIEGGQPVAVWERNGAQYFSFAPDSRHAAISIDQSHMQLIDLATGIVVRSLGHGAATSRFSFHEPTRRIAVCTKGSLQIISSESGKVLTELPGPMSSVPDVEWHSSGRFVAAGYYDDNVLLWNVATRQKELTYPHRGGALQLRFDAAGENLLTTNSWSGDSRLWDAGSGQLLLNVLTVFFRSHNLSASGKHSLLSRVEDQLEVWEVEPADECRVVSYGRSDSRPLGNAHTTGISPDGQIFVVGRQNGFELWDVASGEQLAQVVGTGIARFDRKSNLLAGSDLGVIRWSRHDRISTNDDSLPATRKSMSIRFGPPEILSGPMIRSSLAVSEDGHLFAIHQTEGWFLRKSDDSQFILALGHLGDSRAAAITRDQRYVAISGFGVEGTRVFDCSTGKLLADLPTQICGEVFFSPDNRWMATSPDGVQLWQVKDWHMMRRLKATGTTPSGLGIAFSPDSQIIAVGQPSGITRFIVPDTGMDIAQLTHPDQICASKLVFTPDQTRLITLESDRGSRARIWNLVAIRRQLAERGLDWPEDLLRPKTRTESDIEPSVQQVTLDEGHLFDKYRAHALYYEATKESGIAARGLMEEAVQLDPENATLHNHLAWLLATGSEEIRDPMRAVEHARKSVALNADSQANCNTLGVALYRVSEFDESLSVLNRSLQLGSDHVKAFDLIFLALCHARLGNWPESNDCYSRTLELVESPSSHFSLNEKEELIRFLNEAKALGLPHK